MAVHVLQLLVSMAGIGWNAEEQLCHPLVWDGGFMGQPPGGKTPAAALLVFEPGDFSVVDAVALQGKPWRILLEFLFIASLAAVAGFALYQQAPLVYEGCVNPLPSSRSAAEPCVGPLQMKPQECYLGSLPCHRSVWRFVSESTN